jgi:hypothetical protein
LNALKGRKVREFGERPEKRVFVEDSKMFWRKKVDRDWRSKIVF